MDVDHAPTYDATVSAIGRARLDRRSLLRRSALGFAIPAALTAANLTTGRASAQTTEATPAASPLPAAGNYASVNGLDLYYEVHGAGEPLVLLHGGFGTIATDFGRLLPTFAQNRQVIGVELQAHGHTADIDRPFSFEAMADDVAALLDHLGLDSADLFGFSLGGGVALQIAIRRPELVRKLVIASTVFRRDGWHPEVLAGMSQMTAEAAAAMRETPIYQVYVQVAPRPEDFPVLVGKLGELLAQDYDWTEDIKTVTAPTLLVFGDADNVRPAHALELFELLGGGGPGDLGAVSNAELALLPRTTHFGVLGRTDLLLPIIPPFLDAPLPEAG
ncbi:MAG: alpha/beta fold hydrolase [Thermomicrobiales bacterium]